MCNIIISKISTPSLKAIAVKEVLADLPQWFGLPKSTKEYIDQSQNKPCWIAHSPIQGQDFSKIEPKDILGFVSLKQTSPYVFEIYCMGIKKAYHRMGLGTKLFDKAKTYAKEKGAEYMQVKTVEKGHYEEYDQTVSFYEKTGFRPLEVFPTLWDEHNPCLILIQKI